MSPGRVVHLIALLATIILATATAFAIPALWKDSVTAFATVGGFFTFYGVVFAAIETARARSAASLAKTAAEKASSATAGLYNLRNIVECQTAIKVALQDMDRDGWASASSLSRILELYTAEFHELYNDANAPQRVAIGALQSHAATPPGRLTNRAFKNLKETLLSMLTDVTVASGARLSELQQ